MHEGTRQRTLLSHAPIGSVVCYGLALLLAPLFSAIILKVKAWYAGKRGPPLLIGYFTLAKLLRKGSVYSTSSTLLFRLGPVVSVGAVLVALAFMPAGHRGWPAPGAHRRGVAVATRATLARVLCAQELSINRQLLVLLFQGAVGPPPRRRE